MEINLSLHPKQASALESKATEILYGGAAGGGKSHLMRVAAIMWCASIPGLQVYIFRRVREDLIKNHVEGPKGFRSILSPWTDSGHVKIVEEEIRFWNGSKIYLCHCKDEKDRFKYQGAEIHVLLIDELTTFTEVIFRFLRSRVRAVGLNLPEQMKGRIPCILCSSNPAGVGHNWVKDTFIDPAPAYDVYRTDDSEGGFLRQFIPALLEDNPSMTEDDPGYRARLRGLGSPALVKAFEKGDWNIIIGSFFPEWGDKNIIEPVTLPRHWVRFSSFDWGFAKPFSVGWWAVSDGQPFLPSTGDTAKTLAEIKRAKVYPCHSLIRYREWYGAAKANVGLRMTTRDIATGMLAREVRGENLLYRVADPSIFAEDRGPSIAEDFSNSGVFWTPADNTRIPGWNQVRARIVGEDDKPLLYVFNTCRDAIRLMPSLQHSETRPEDADTNNEDHLHDEIRYAAMSRPWPASNKDNESPKGRGLKEMTYDELLEAEERYNKGVR